MAEEVILPRVDMDMAEGKIARWYVRNGDPVQRGQVIFEIETDKATMEIEATADGVLAGCDGVTDVLLPVGQVVAWILQPGETVPVAATSAPAGQDRVAGTGGEPAGGGPSTSLPVRGVAASPAHAIATTATASESVAGVGAHATAASAAAAVGAGAPAQPTQLLRATPLARSSARAQGIDLHAVRGSGPNGRILARDLQGAGVAGAAVGSAQPLHLHWLRRAAGVPLVLLHGFATSSGSWRALAQQLGDRPVLGIDLPNHGKSPRMVVADLDQVARLVLQRLDQEGIGALHLLGHSMGGGAALALAPLLQQRMRSLTLLAPLGLGPQIDGAFIQGILRARGLPSLRPWLATLFGDPAQLTGSFAATAWSELEAPETRAALQAMAEQLLPDGTQASGLRERLARLAESTVPVKLVWGTLDRIVPCQQAQALPGAVALHLLPGIGHLPHIEAIGLLAQLVRQQVAAGDAQAADAAGTGFTPPPTQTPPPRTFAPPTTPIPAPPVVSAPAP